MFGYIDWSNNNRARDWCVQVFWCVWSIYMRVLCKISQHHHWYSNVPQLRVRCMWCWTTCGNWRWIKNDFFSDKNIISFDQPWTASFSKPTSSSNCSTWLTLEIAISIAPILRLTKRCRPIFAFDKASWLRSLPTRNLVCEHWWRKVVSISKTRSQQQRRKRTVVICFID